MSKYRHCDSLLMAEFSKLAYVVFEKKIEEGLLSRYIGIHGFELFETFNVNGTQAFIANRHEDEVSVLSFRGTEIDKSSDIDSNIKLSMKDSTSGKTHEGFQASFNDVRDKIEKSLKKICGYKLYITGHSLGGALALIATSNLDYDKIFACYTFGCPMVGDQVFSNSIKYPVYRVVNAYDIVPKLPLPKYLVSLIVWFLKKTGDAFLFSETLSKLIYTSIGGYVHHGELIYLTSCKNTDYSDAMLIKNLKNVCVFYILLKNIRSFGRLIDDHDIKKYCLKLNNFIQNYN